MLVKHDRSNANYAFVAVAAGSIFD